MKIVFFGSGNFAIPVLEGLLSNGQEVLAVVTQPDKEAGRHLKITPTPIKNYALKNRLPVLQPRDLGNAEIFDNLNKLAADLFVVVQYGIIIPRAILEIPRIMPINAHASLLPRYRGAAPINWAIINGEKETGISVIKMNERMDKGALILRRSIPIADSDDAETLSARLSDLAAGCILDALDLIKDNKYTLAEQNDNLSSYARKLIKEDGLINWHRNSREIFNQVRGLIPWPAAYTRFGKRTLKIWQAGCGGFTADSAINPGEVLAVTSDSIMVSCKDSALAVKEVQLDSGKRMPAHAFALGHKIKKGDKLG